MIVYLSCVVARGLGDEATSLPLLQGIESRIYKQGELVKFVFNDLHLLIGERFALPVLRSAFQSPSPENVIELPAAAI